MGRNVTLKSPYKNRILAEKALEKAEDAVSAYENTIRHRCKDLVKEKYSRYVTVFITSLNYDSKMHRFDFVADCWDVDPSFEDVRYESGDYYYFYVNQKEIESSKWMDTKLHPMK